MTTEAIDTEFADLTRTLGQAPASGIDILKLTEDDRFTTFSAKYRVEEDRFSLQFFSSPEKAGECTYWEEVFPRVLEAAIERVFPPELRAPGYVLRGEYVGDFQLNSWYLRGEGMLGDDLAERIHTLLLPVLDSMLEERITK